MNIIYINNIVFDVRFKLSFNNEQCNSMNTIAFDMGQFFVCLVFNGTSTQDRSICANCGRVKPTQLAKDGQRDTKHNRQN